MATDGLVYPPLGLYTGKIDPRVGLTEYTRLVNLQSAGVFGAGSSGAEGAGNPTVVTEAEPNDTRALAQFVNLGNLPGKTSSVDILGSMSIASRDEDFYSFDLVAGDIFEARLTGSTLLGNFDISLQNSANLELAANTRALGSPLPARPTVPFPNNSPLLTNGDAGVAVVIPADGRYYLRVLGGDRSYTLTMRTHRAPLESAPIGTKQKLFLDFDGAQIRRDTFDFNIASATLLTGTARLSPLANFLQGWGLQPSDENAVIDAIISLTKRTFDTVRANGNNGSYPDTGVPGDFDIEILNSRDHGEQWGLPNVSRVIVGGTSAELGIGGLLGIAESIDIGNFDREETAVVLLDGMLASYGGVQRAGNVPLVNALVSGITNTITHEAGHFFGSFHVLDNANVQIMDTIGLASDNLGAGLDRILGTPDDILVPFGTDVYDPNAGSIRFGTVNTAATLAFGLSTGTVGSFINGSVYVDRNLNRTRDAGELGLASAIVYADLNNNDILDAGEPKAPVRADGTYTLAVNPGAYVIRQNPVSGFARSAPTNNAYSVTLALGQAVQNIDFGNTQIDLTATGFKFNDLNGNGVVDTGEPRVSGIWFYLDLDGDQRIDIGEPATQSGADGRYSLRFPGPGTYAIREVLEPGSIQTFPGPAANNQHVVTITGNPAVDALAIAGLNFGNRSFLDFGDAPASYGTLRANNGAAHGFISGVFLGANWDAEQDGQPTANALGDDANGNRDPLDVVIDDEDGVTLARPLARTTTNLLNVTAVNSSTSPAYVHAWIDLNGDGDFTDSGEKVISNASVLTGTQTISFPGLGGARLGDTYLRVRMSQDRDLGATGLSGSGEVEDYLVTIVDTPQIAVNDQFSVPRNSILNPLSVTLNDFTVPGEVLTIVSAGPSRAGGILQVTGDNRILYTPPNGFVGQDTFPYTILTNTGESATANVTIDVNLFFEDPMAIDDSFDVATNAISFPLNVLANDIEGRAGALSIISVTQPNLGGQITIATGGQSLRYTPVRNLGSTEQFTYTVGDSSGKTATATVTLHTLPGDQANDDVLIRLVPTDLSGNPITAVQQGQDFRVDVFVDDLRNDRNPPVIVSAPGVFAAYLDILYNLQLVTTVPSAPGSRLDFDTTFFSGYDNFQRGDATIPGIINDFGAFNSSTTLSQSNPVRLASIRFTARSPGIANFGADPADNPPQTDTILFDVPGSAVPIERIRYTGSSIEIVGDSVEFPQAVDDSFATNVPAGALNFPLLVLPNDRPGSTNVIRLTGVSQPSNGSAVINNNGTPSIPGDDRILYTPSAGFQGTDSFTYTITDARGIQSSAAVTVRVGATDANDDVALRLQLFKENGTPLADGENLTVGSKFQLRGFVQDLRNPFGSRRGVFAAFEDVIYAASLVSPVASSTNPLGFDITFGPNYSRVPPVNSGDIRVPGLINEVGALQSDNGGNPVGTADELLFTIVFTANRIGTATFIGDPADIKPLHDTLLFEPPTAVIADRIRFGFDSVNIVAATGAGGEGNTNQNNRFDVNDDGSVTALDALFVVNSINTGGSLVSGGEGEERRLYLDVNGDGISSPMDALLVINYLNTGGALAGEGEGESLAPVIESNVGMDSLQSESTGESALQTTKGGSTVGVRDTGVVYGPATTLDWSNPSDGGDEESLDDLLSQLAPDVGSIWKRR